MSATNILTIVRTASVDQWLAGVGCSEAESVVRRLEVEVRIVANARVWCSKAMLRQAIPGGARESGCV